MTTSEVILLVKKRFEAVLQQSVQVTTIHPEGRKGWTVFVKVGGIVWRQQVSSQGVLGNCTAICADRRKPRERHLPSP